MGVAQVQVPSRAPMKGVTARTMRPVMESAPDRPPVEPPVDEAVTPDPGRPRVKRPLVAPPAERPRGMAYGAAAAHEVRSPAVMTSETAVPLDVAVIVP